MKTKPANGSHNAGPTTKCGGALDAPPRVSSSAAAGPSPLPTSAAMLTKLSGGLMSIPGFKQHLRVLLDNTNGGSSSNSHRVSATANAHKPALIGAQQSASPAAVKTAELLRARASVRRQQMAHGGDKENAVM